MKLKKIIQISQLITKILQLRFDTAQKNYNVMKFCKYANEKNEFYLNEKQKLFDNFGAMKDENIIEIKKEHEADYFIAINDIFDIELNNPVKLLIEMNDFENCAYPKDNELWLNAQEMLIIEEFLNEQLELEKKE